MAKKTTVVDAYYLTFRDGRSNKYYEVLITEDGTTVLHWGRMHTAGQSSVSVMSNYEDAHDIAMRQVYAKKSKGYNQDRADKFVIDSELVRYAKEGNTVPLFNAINEARREGKFTGMKDAVLTHYKDLADQAQSLMNRADGMDFEQVEAEFDELKQVWEEIQDKHAEIATVIGLAEATFTRKLLGI
jgi:predicted DNA-binding WGR domain protein